MSEAISFKSLYLAATTHNAPWSPGVVRYADADPANKAMLTAIRRAFDSGGNPLVGLRLIDEVLADMLSFRRDEG